MHRERRGPCYEVRAFSFSFSFQNILLNLCCEQIFRCLQRLQRIKWRRNEWPNKIEYILVHKVLITRYRKEVNKHMCFSLHQQLMKFPATWDGCTSKMRRATGRLSEWGEDNREGFLGAFLNVTISLLFPFFLTCPLPFACVWHFCIFLLYPQDSVSGKSNILMVGGLLQCTEPDNPGGSETRNETLPLFTNTEFLMISQKKCQTYSGSNV